jgi:hypothetical protein
MHLKVTRPCVHHKQAWYQNAQKYPSIQEGAPTWAARRRGGQAYRDWRESRCAARRRPSRCVATRWQESEIAAPSPACTRALSSRPSHAKMHIVLRMPNGELEYGNGRAGGAQGGLPTVIMTGTSRARGRMSRRRSTPMRVADTARLHECMCMHAYMYRS